MSKTKFTKGDMIINQDEQSRDYELLLRAGGDSCYMVAENIIDFNDAHLFKTAPKLYAKLDELSALMIILDEQTHANIELDAVKYDIDKLLAEARGEEWN